MRLNTPLFVRYGFSLSLKRVYRTMYCFRSMAATIVNILTGKYSCTASSTYTSGMQMTLRLLLSQRADDRPSAALLVVHLSGKEEITWSQPQDTSGGDTHGQAREFCAQSLISTTNPTMHRRVEAVRIFLEDKLGVVAFKAAHDVLSAVTEESDECDVVGQLDSIMSTAEQDLYLPILLQFVSCEHMLYNSATP